MSEAKSPTRPATIDQPGYVTGEYVADVHRNVVPGRFYGDTVSTRVLFGALYDVTDAGRYLDRIKKAVIYGKQDARLTPVGESTAESDRVTNCVPADLMHAIIGIATEAAELVEAATDAMDSREPLDVVNLREEIGDILWYSTFLAKSLGTTLDECAATNTRKLRKRFPNNFTDEQAINRDVDSEREVLEKDAE